jgi:transcriptional regulator with XRE-family HTH domain
MQFAVEEQFARISRRIRRWREDEDLTLQELADRGGLATSTVQKVETGNMMPSLAVLLKLAHGLRRPVTDLLVDDDDAREVFHSKACERESVGAGSNLVVERLTGDLANSELETWKLVLAPGSSSGSDPIQYDGEELVVCEEGQVTFRVGEDEYPLLAGDSLHFRASIPHSWYNDGSTKAKFTLTGTLPLQLRILMQSRIVLPAPSDGYALR